MTEASAKNRANAVALIPARLGSKRIPSKNIRHFNGLPLIAYSIRAALESQLFSNVIVSTDCERIAATAKSFGADVPFMRPTNIADDFATINDVVTHALDELEKIGKNPEYLCCLFATAPMISVKDLKYGLQQLQAHPGFNQALAVTPFDFPIQRALQLDAFQGLSYAHPRYTSTRSQDLEPYYHDAGQFFWSRIQGKVNEAASGALPVFIDRFRVQDIDTPEDWETAELKYQAWQLRLKTKGHAA